MPGPVLRSGLLPVGTYLLCHEIQWSEEDHLDKRISTVNGPSFGDKTGVLAPFITDDGKNCPQYGDNSTCRPWVSSVHLDITKS